MPTRAWSAIIRPMLEFIKNQYMDKETIEVMDELRSEGFEFEGDKPKEEKPEDKPQEPKESKSDEKPKDEDLKEKPEEEEQKIERLPREPKKVKLPDGTETEAWRLKVKEKHESKEEVNLLDKIGRMMDEKLESLQLKNKPASETEVRDAFKIIADKYELGEKGADFIKDLGEVFSSQFGKQNIPDDIKQKLGIVDELAIKNKQVQEDNQFEAEFYKNVLPKLKEENPDIEEANISEIKSKIKNHYFSDKYINLSADEIFVLKKNELDLGSKAKRPLDSGSKSGSSRNIIVNYDNITEDEYNNLSDEEQEKVDDYRIKKQKGLI